MNRRSFLTVGAVLPLAASRSSDLSAAKPSPSSAAVPTGQSAPAKQGFLPGIPESRDLASERLVHDYRDPFNPPTAQNEWGYCQATKSISGVSAILFPPFSCCGSPEIRFTAGNLITCELFLNGRIVSSYPAPEGRVAYTWYPHRILRETHVQGLRFTTQTFVPAKQRAVAELITVKNESREQRKLSLGFNMRAGVSYKAGPWYVGDPAELDNRLSANESQGYIVFESLHSRAISVQGITPRPSRLEQSRMLIYEFSLNPGEARAFQYVNAIGDDRTAVLEAYALQQAGFRHLLEENETVYSARIRAAFTPGNSEFSGYLPQLLTRDPVLWRLYYASFADLLMARRVSPDCVYGPTYLTVPRGISTLIFIWDAMLTSLSMALLDPRALRVLLENWFVAGMHEHLATDYLTGKGMGPWYAVNDMGILRCAHDYLRVTGDFAWLDKSVDGKRVLEHLVDHALYWKKLDKYGHGLGDYGTLDNLLEAVSNWTHEVAAMNAGNVYGMRFVASLLDHRGDSARAAQYRQEAKDLAARINRLLYVEGKGWWKCGQPDGTYREVRHCYDLLTVLDTMFDDLSDRQKKEMAHFFWSELYTPLWMHALSPGDPDASWSPGAFDGLRSDHTWLGAYIAWPPMTAKGLYKIDPSSRVSAWVKGFAKAANQGPFGQAHLVETTFPPDAGGARKDPDGGWYEAAGGNYMNLVIDTIFGADLTLYNGIQVNSRLNDFDPAARLANLNYQGRNCTLSGEGVQHMP